MTSLKQLAGLVLPGSRTGKLIAAQLENLSYKLSTID
jgi:hypothetical protein